MSGSELAILCFGLTQYLLFAFAQEAMLIGASEKQQRFVDPTASLFSLNDLPKGTISGVFNVYLQFFKGFFTFFQHPFFGKFDGNACETPTEAGLFERRSIDRLRFFLYLFNFLGLFALLVGLLFALHQNGPETFIRPVDLFLIFAFNIFTVACLVLAYEARVHILRGRYAMIIDGLSRRKSDRSGTVTIEKIIERAIFQMEANRNDIADRVGSLHYRDDKVVPYGSDDIVKQLALDPERLRQLLIENDIAQETRNVA